MSNKYVDIDYINALTTAICNIDLTLDRISLCKCNYGSCADKRHLLSLREELYRQLSAYTFSL